MWKSVTMAHCKQTLTTAVVFLALLVGCGGETGEGEAQQAPGQAAFGRYCAACHGPEGQGRAPTFPPLAGSEWLTLPPEGLTAIILLGLRGEIEVSGQAYAGYMPPMQHIDDAQVADIVGYIKRRWSQAGAGEWTTGDVARIRAELAGRSALEGREGINQVIEELQ